MSQIRKPLLLNTFTFSWCLGFEMLNEIQGRNNGWPIHLLLTFFSHSSILELLCQP